MTSWAERQRAADETWRHDRVTAETVPCTEPDCGALVGETCRNVHTGQPLERQAAHAKRIEAGRAAAEETQG
jgi:hypothetical protein